MTKPVRPSIETTRSSKDRTALAPLLNPENVVLVGVSEKPNSYGRALLNNCISGGFSRPIYPVITKGECISGRKVFSSVAELPERPDHVVLSVANDRVEKAASKALAMK